MVEMSQTAPRLDIGTAQSIRRVYGYIGHIQKIDRSANKDMAFLLAIAIDV